jgi:galactofuranose transport system permease protein
MTRVREFVSRNANVLITVAAFIAMFGGASVAYRNFLSPQVFMNLLIDNAHLGIIAIGMTLVISSGSGGIDLSVGAIMGLTTMIVSSLAMKAHVSPLLIIPFVLVVGMTLGFGMGCMIQFFRVPPFIATLAGQYFARGLCNLISLDQIQVTQGFFYDIAQLRIWVGPHTAVSVNVVIYAIVLIVALWFARFSRTGRVIYAMGGSEQSAILMGLPVKRAKLAVYTISGFCSALAGIVFIIYMGSGYVKHGEGLEMDAIASAVIGGTLLTGGVGPLLGTVFGTFIMGTIQTIINFQGTLSAWWTRIVIGILIMVSILIQNILGKAKRGKAKAVVKQDTKDAA